VSFTCFPSPTLFVLNETYAPKIEVEACSTLKQRTRAISTVKKKKKQKHDKQIFMIGTFNSPYSISSFNQHSFLSMNCAYKNFFQEPQIASAGLN